MINLKINKCLLVNLNKGVNMKTQKKEVLATSEIKKGEVVNSQNVKFDTAIVKNAVDKLDTKKLTNILQSALNVSENLYKWLPKLAYEVSQKIKEYNASLDENSINILNDIAILTDSDLISSYKGDLISVSTRRNSFSNIYDCCDC